MSDAAGSMPPFEEPILLDDAPGWPKHIGILSIIWAALGMTCAGCGGLGMLAGPMFQNMVPEEQRAQMVQPPTSMIAIISLFFSFGLGVLLLVAGISTMRRNPAGRSLHLVYAVLTLVLIVVGLVDGVLHASVMDQWAKDNPQVPAAKFMNKQSVILQAVLATAIRLIWPTFCLIWFGLVKRTPEAMTGKPLPAGPG